VAPKAGFKHGVTNVRTVVARPKLICWQSHAAAGAASSKHVAVSRSRSISCNASMDPATFTNMTYAGFGLAGLSFVGTFFGECCYAGAGMELGTKGCWSGDSSSRLCNSSSNKDSLGQHQL
jgi:hypothetical protein